MHGTLMIFLVIFPLLAGFGNYFVPLQIGALDMAFPRINALSFWLLPVGGLTILSGFFAKGGAAAAGWTGYPPLSEQLGTGQDLWIAGLIIVGTASILGGINFIVTILRMRAPGMTMMRMPVFTWSILATSLLVVLAAPVLTAGLIMLFADRRLGTVFFDPTQAGVVILWQHVFWFFGHPEVYMLILGAWGIVTRDHLGVLGQADLQLPGRRAVLPADHGAVVQRVGAPHVRDRRGGAAVLQRHDRADLDPDRRALLHLAGHALERDGCASSRPCSSRSASSRCS